MYSSPKSPRHVKFRIRSSNEIEEGSYVSYTKLDGGIVSFLFSFKNQTTLDRLKIKHDEMPISTVGICMSENSIKNSESWYSKEFEL